MPLHVRLTLPTGTKTLKLPDRGNDRPIVFGRSASAAVKVPAETPQEDHCGLFAHDGQWYACDLYQAGQVLVNGHPADEPTAVQQGDVITIGTGGATSVEVGAVVPAAAAPAATPAAQHPAPAQERPTASHAAAAQQAAPSHYDPAAQYPAQQPAYEPQPAAYTSASYARPKRKGSPLPIILGGAVALLVVGGGTAFLLTRGGDKDKAAGDKSKANDPAAAPPAAVETPIGGAAPVVETDPGFADPVEAARAFVRALETGKKSSLKKATTGWTDDHLTAVDPLKELSYAARVLEDASVARFGEAGRGVVPTGLALTSEACAGSNLKTTPRGQDAVVTVPGNFPALPVRKTPTGWKVDLAAMYPDAKAAAKAAPATASAQQALRGVFGGASERTQAGAYKSAADLKADVAAGLAKLPGRGAPPAP